MLVIQSSLQDRSSLFRALYKTDPPQAHYSVSRHILLLFRALYKTDPRYSELSTRQILHRRNTLSIDIYYCYSELSTRQILVIQSSLQDRSSLFRALYKTDPPQAQSSVYRHILLLFRALYKTDPRYSELSTRQILHRRKTLSIDIHYCCSELSPQDQYSTYVLCHPPEMSCFSSDAHTTLHRRLIRPGTVRSACTPPSGCLYISL